jgi:tRNA (guanine-N7-)-methyltransferase
MNDPKDPPAPDAVPTWGPMRSFGRIRSRTLKPRQAALFDTLLPKVALPDPSQGPIEPLALMPGAQAVWLEIGFGGGEHLCAQAARHPEALMIGCEPFLNGVGSALRHIEEAGLTNVRLHPGDARDVIKALPPSSLDRVMILFPDPWPKARHHKRRLIQHDFVAELVSRMKPGAELRFVTDWKAYGAHALEILGASEALEWMAEEADDWRQAPHDHVTTRYEEKKLGDTAPIFLRFRRR